ncbi:tricarboxylate transport protein, mitochondrial-like [Dermatophagoides pteronyssinus]|uniref:tricarboxylate transport protein, mitochondrial-like n=1 Tax=Dermatophagoides pteronyssinus TaxID=6956 RepID=UPI003F668D93
MANNSMLLTPNSTTTTTTKTTNEMIGKKRKTELPILNTYWINTGKQLFASGLSGCVEVCFTYPTDFVKIILQLDERSGKKRRFKNSFDVIRHTLRSYGILGVYRGFSVVFYGAIPKYMFRFGLYEQIKRFYVDNDGQLRSKDKLICGLGAGIFEALFAVIPQESIKVKFINDRFSDRPKYNGLIHGIKEIIREKGIRGTYQGVMPTLIKQGSNQAIRFFVFDSLQEWHNNRQPMDKDKNKKILIPIFGAIAGATSVFGNTPMDVVKTRMQGLEAHKYRGVIHCMTKIYRNEGLLGFYKGLVPRLVKVSLEVAIAFTMYSAFSDLFGINK